MNEIAAKLGEVGLPAPLSELAAREWDADRLSPRTPIPGVYLCGAATHPGGSVIALNGPNAAHAVLAARLEEPAAT